MYRIIFILLSATVVLGACATQYEETKIVEDRKPQAIEIAQETANYELQCPENTAQIVNDKAVALGGKASWSGGPQTLEWTDYAVSVSGCGQHKTYQVTCPPQSSCYVESRPGSRPQPR
jgi:hypothetical protein